MKVTPKVLMGFVGDLLVNRSRPLDAFSAVREVLSAPQILFGNLETRIGFLPCKLTPDGLVHPLRPESAEATEVERFVEKCNSTQGLRGVITASGAVPLAGFETLRVVPP